MKLSFWSDEDWLFVQRRIGFGWSINFKFIAKKLGWIKSLPHEDRKQSVEKPEQASHIERLKRQIEDSRYEERR